MNEHQTRAIGADSRIGPNFLNASIGFGGSCFQKDILNLVYICESEGLHEAAKYWQMVVDMNEHQKQTFAGNIISKLLNTVTGKKIAVLGFAFKKDTGDVRETPAVSVCNMLLRDGANVTVYDPKVKREDALTEFNYHKMSVDESRLTFAKTPEEAVDGAHALVVLTEWDEFKQYPYEEFYAKMMKPAFLFDGRSILDHTKLEDSASRCTLSARDAAPTGGCVPCPSCRPCRARKSLLHLITAPFGAGEQIQYRSVLISRLAVVCQALRAVELSRF